MSEAKKRSRAWIGWALVVALPLYVLSCFPSAWLVGHGYIDERLATVAYAPLNWALECFMAMHRWLTDWYLRLWNH